MPQPIQHGWGHGRRAFPRRHGRRVGAAPSLSDQVQAMLAGTTGWAFDPSDTARMWQDSAKTTPVVAASDPVGAIDTKWGMATYTFAQATGASRPIWDGACGLTYDGVDDHLEITASDMLQDKPAVYLADRVKYTTLSNYDFHLSTTAAAAQRFSSSTDGTGLWAIGGRILDASGTTFVSSAAGALVTGVDYTLARQIDYAITKGVTGWRNGTVVISGLLGGTAANTQNTASATVTHAATSTGVAPFLSGKIGRRVFCPFLPTAGQITTINAWLAEGAAL